MVENICISNYVFLDSHYINNVYLLVLLQRQNHRARYQHIAVYPGIVVDDNMTDKIIIHLPIECRTLRGVRKSANDVVVFYVNVLGVPMTFVWFGIFVMTLLYFPQFVPFALFLFLLTGFTALMAIALDISVWCIRCREEYK